MTQEGLKILPCSTGFLLLKIPQVVLDEIKVVVDKTQKDFTKLQPANDGLVGQIDKEFLLTLPPKTTNYIKSVVEQYDKSYPLPLIEVRNKRKPKSTKLTYSGEAWINFQKKYEYNPIHRHNGLFSYVIWYQIPFYREDEIKYGAGKGKRKEINTNGDFQFISNYRNQILPTSLFIDRKMEGYIAMFPSDLNHVVHPFYTSDDYRITISGNIYIQD